MVSLSKKTKEVFYLNLKNSSDLQATGKNDKPFAQELEAITDLTFAEFYTLLVEAAWGLAEAYALFGRDNHREIAERLAFANLKLAEFASVQPNFLNQDSKRKAGRGERKEPWA